MLDTSKIERIRSKGSKQIGRCPACAEHGGDNNADHLIINEDGKFGCVVNQGAEGKDHRKRIAELVGLPIEKPTKRTYTALPHAPTNQPLPDLRHYKHGRPSAHWIYRTEDGNIAGIIARFDLSTGKKETLPMVWCKDSIGGSTWQWKAMKEPRPLYNLPFPSGTIVIVEGEKCAESVNRAGYHATTWAGGCAAMSKTDFSTLSGKDVVIWPDNDAPGKRAAESIAAIIKPYAASVKFVQIPDHAPQAWDAADTDDDTISQLISSAKEPQARPVTDCFEQTDDAPRDRLLDLPFRILGMDDGQMRYMPDNGQHVVSLTPASHSKLNLMQLAPLQTWEQCFPGKTGCDWDAACNALIQYSQSMPKFDPRLIRGRGCWIDGEDVVYHAGDKLAVGGRVMPIPRYNSTERAIYEAGLSIAIDTPNPAKNAESAQLITLCEMLSFEQPLFGKLLAGWIALAPICGAMQWRPHVWVTGASGSGKTWIMGNIVKPLVGRSAVFVQGNTSEAGIRGQLGSDALPVMFDEAEAENQRSGTRMEGVLELARQSSSESGAGIVKGTQSGGSITYMVRSMFCFASIGVAAVKKADTSRITVLGLRKADDPEQFKRLVALWRETVANDDYCARIRARSIANARITRHNAEVFSMAAVAHTGDKRSADQIGTLLAGAYSLASSREITEEAATEWLNKQDWSGFKVDAVDADENQCMAHLFSSIIRVEKQFGAEQITIDEAVQRIKLGVNCEPEQMALLRIGIKIEPDQMAIANNHQGLERCFANTPWAGAKWKGQFMRVYGAHASKNPERFGSKVLQRAVFVPL
jgi:putative DNA primase/helicase